MNLISVNGLAHEVVSNLVARKDFYGVQVEKLSSGATVIDSGLKANGGYDAGVMVTRVAMGGIGSVALQYSVYGSLKLPSIVVSTDYPAISLFGAQLAGWKIKAEGYVGDGSGPARALALKPKEVFQKIDYKDQSNYAVILLEGEEKPNDNAAYYIADRCGVKPENVYMVLTSTRSLAGMVQISGRIVETGLFRLDVLGIDPKKVLHGIGYAPVMPLHTDVGKAMGRAEDALTYGGVTSFIVDEDEDVLAEKVEKAPSSNCKEYGRTSYDIYKSVEFDFTKIDPAIFAPAQITLVSAKTGKVFTRGKINDEMLERSINS